MLLLVDRGEGLHEASNGMTLDRVCRWWHGTLVAGVMMKPTKQLGKTLQVTKEDGQKKRARENECEQLVDVCVCVQSCLASVNKHSDPLPNEQPPKPVQRGFRLGSRDVST